MFLINALSLRYFARKPTRLRTLWCDIDVCFYSSILLLFYYIFCFIVIFCVVLIPFAAHASYLRVPPTHLFAATVKSLDPPPVKRKALVSPEALLRVTNSGLEFSTRPWLALVLRRTVSSADRRIAPSAVFCLSTADPCAPQAERSGLQAAAHQPYHCRLVQPVQGLDRFKGCAILPGHFNNTRGVCAR